MEIEKVDNRKRKGGKRLIHKLAANSEQLRITTPHGNKYMIRLCPTSKYDDLEIHKQFAAHPLVIRCQSSNVIQLEGDE